MPEAAEVVDDMLLCLVEVLCRRNIELVRPTRGGFTDPRPDNDLLSVVSPTTPAPANMSSVTFSSPLGVGN